MKRHNRPIALLVVLVLVATLALGLPTAFAQEPPVQSGVPSAEPSGEPSGEPPPSASTDPAPSQPAEQAEPFADPSATAIPALNEEALAQVMLLAQTDGKAAALEINKYASDTGFLDAVLKVVCYYMDTEDAQNLALFEATIDRSALDAIALYKAERAEKTTKTPVDESGMPYVPGEVIVVFSEAAAPMQEEQAISELAASPMEELPGEAVVVEIPDDMTVIEAVAELEKDPAVEYAQPNFIYTLQVSDTEAETAEQPVGAQAAPNDPLAAQQWHWGAPEMGGVGLYDAWDRLAANGGGSMVKVAVLDSGLDLSHPDITPYLTYDCYNSRPLTGDNSPISHGTHVAGIIAATANNGVGVVGAGANKVQLLVGNVYGADGSTTVSSQLKKGIDWAATNGARIVNLSMGIRRTYPFADNSADRLVENAINTYTNQGVLFVCAGGNSGGSDTTVDDGFNYPGDLEACISVTATLKDGTRAGYSEHNQNKNIAAPGGVGGTGNITNNILSTFRTDLAGNPQTGYNGEGGTSMAAPIVAGVAALLLSADPTLTPAEIKELLYTTATDKGAADWDPVFGWGIVNADAAMSKLIATRRVRGIELDKTEIEVYTGRTVSLNANILPSGVNYDDIVWISDTPESADVTGSGFSAVVSGKAKGAAVITAETAYGGHVAECEVYVRQSVTSITLNRRELFLDTGESAGFLATVLPYDAENRAILCTSSDPSVATVSSTGVIRGVKAGRAVITVAATDGSGVTDTCAVTVAQTTALAAPTGVTATVTGYSGVELSWRAVAGATGYEFWRSDDGIAYAKVATLSGLAYRDVTLVTGKTYYFKVRAYNAAGSGAFSIALVAQPRPVAPSGVWVETVDKTSITVGWSQVTGSHGYDVYRAAVPGGPYTLIARVNNTTFTYMDAGLSMGDEYYYKIRDYRTVDGVNYASPYTDAVYGRAALPAPQNVYALQGGWQGVKVVWDLIPGVTRYQIYRSTSEYGTYTNVGETSERAMTVYGMTTGQRYYFKVRGVDMSTGKAVAGTFTEVVSRIPVPGEIKPLAATPGSLNCVNLSWEPMSGAHNYYIYRSTSPNGTYTLIGKSMIHEQTTFVDTGVPRGVVYYYKVCGVYNANGILVAGPLTVIPASSKAGG